MALKILLADDSATAQNMGKKILVEAGYEVVAVSNGAAAVKKIAEHKPDMIVLDVYMPGYTGLEVCERVKSAIETTKIPVLLTVGKMEHFLPEEGARVKADGVIVKPFEASDLLAAVQKLEQRLTSTNSRAAQAKVMVTPAEPPLEEPPEYERTLKIKTPIFDEKDESYQTWKSETDESAPVPQAGVELPEEDFPSAPPEPHSVNVPTEMRAAPAMGLEHLGSSDMPHAERTTSELMEHSELEGSAAEANPYQINEEGADDRPRSGVGRLFSKAKSWFGGASSLEGYEDEAGRVAADEGEAETVTLSPGQVHETHTVARHAEESHLDESLETLAPISSPAASSEVRTLPPPPTVFHEQTEAPAAHMEMAAAASPMESKTESYDAVPDLHLRGAAPSWEPPLSESDAAVSVEAVYGVHPPNLEAPALEVISSDSEYSAASGMASELEVTSPHSAHDVPSGAASESMLVTDVSEMSTQFPTRFGVADAEPVPVGNAADYPELYGHPAQSEETTSSSDTQEIEAPELIDAAEAVQADEAPTEHTADFDTAVADEVAAAMGSRWSQNDEPAAHVDAAPSHSHEASLSGWSAEETHLDENEIDVSLHDEMHQHLSEPPAGPEPEVAEPELPVIAQTQPAPANTPDAQLAAAMAAAMGKEVTPALTEAVHQAFTGDSTIALDKNTAVIAEIVHRVTERMKPELVAEIARELASEIKKEKQKS